MKIALDYDETFTAAPVLWKMFVEMAKQQGHDVKFVTYRDPRWGNEDICADACDLGIKIIFTAGKQKQHVYQADIWIDDSPETIVSFDKLCNMRNGCLVNRDRGADPLFKVGDELKMKDYDHTIVILEVYDDDDEGYEYSGVGVKYKAMKHVYTEKELVTCYELIVDSSNTSV